MSTTNPNDDPLLKRIVALEQLLQANLNRSLSVERGVTEYKDQSTLLITDSNFRVVGIAYVEGRFEGEGTLSWSGPALFDGPVEITNTLRVLAETTLEGLTKLLGELIVQGGKITAGDVRIEDGKIYVNGMVLDPNEHGGAITFPNGAQVFTDGDTVQLVQGNSVVQVTNGYARLQNGGNVVEINSNGVRVSPAAIPSVPGTGLPVPGVIIQASDGYFRKSDGT